MALSTTKFDDWKHHISPIKPARIWGVVPSDGWQGMQNPIESRFLNQDRMDLRAKTYKRHREKLMMVILWDGIHRVSRPHQPRLLVQRELPDFDQNSLGRELCWVLGGRGGRDQWSAIYHWLVVWKIFYFPIYWYILGMMIQSDPYFWKGMKPPTRSACLTRKFPGWLDVNVVKMVDPKPSKPSGIDLPSPMTDLHN